MAKAKTDKQRISKAFKKLREQGYDATANFTSEKDFQRRGFSNSKMVYLNTSVYEGMFSYDLTKGKVISNGLGDDDNIEDRLGRSKALTLSISRNVDPQDVIDALEAEGLYVDWKGEGFLIVVESHKKPEYENARFDQGKTNGYRAIGLPKFNIDFPYCEGWISGAFERIMEEDRPMANGIMQNYNQLYMLLGKEEAGRIIVPMLDTIIKKYQADIEDVAHQMHVFTR